MQTTFRIFTNCFNMKLQTNAVLLGQVFDHCGRIRSHRQEADHWRSRITLLPHGSQVQDHWVGILRTHRVGDVLACLRRGSVWAPRPSAHTHRQQITSFVSIRVCIFYLNDLPLRSFFIKWQRTKHQYFIAEKNLSLWPKAENEHKLI